MTPSEQSVWIAEGYWPGTMAGDGREVITQRLIDTGEPGEALRIAGADDPRTVWYIAYPVEDTCELRHQRRIEFLRAGGSRK